MSAPPPKKKSPKNVGPTGSSDGNATLRVADTLHLDYFELLAAWRSDLWKTMGNLARSVDLIESVFQESIDGQIFIERIQSRISLALEYINLDFDELDECGGEVRSFKFGRDCVMDLVVNSLCGIPGKTNPLEVLPGDPGIKLIYLQSCMLALIARGQVSLACKLGHIADVLDWIRRNLKKNGTFKKGLEKQLGPDLEKFSLLNSLGACLIDNKLPTRKALRISAFGENKDVGNFSKLLKGMAIEKYIPRESTAVNKNSPHGTFHPIKPSKDHGAAWDEYIKFIQNQTNGQRSQVALIDAEPDTAPYRSITPSANSELPSCEIRRIRESLGSVYWLLLLQFGMSEPKTEEDLEVFIQKLADIGLTLI